MVTTALPLLEVTIGGQRLSEVGTLVAARIDQRLCVPTSCEIVMEPQTKAELAWGELGDRVELRVGGPQERLLFAGELCTREVTYAVHAAPRVSLRAYDPLVQMARAQYVRAHVGVTPGDLLEELARDVGMRVSTDERGPVHAYLVQDRLSNLALCSDLCMRAGLYFFFAGDTLELFPLSRREPSWKPERDEDVLRLDMTRSNTTAPFVKAFGWHPRSNEIHSAESTTDVDAQGQRILTASGAEDPEQTQATIRACVERNRAQTSLMHGLCAGDARLRPGMRVFFPNHVGTDERGYLVCRAIHRFSAETGYVTEISSDPPPKPESPTGATVTLGVVTQVDPSRFNAKVRLPAMDNLETDWMKIVSPGGGTKTGLFLMPHVDDRVLVVCAGGDAGRGIIVGGLIAERGPGLATNDDELPFQLRTRGGTMLEISDEAKSMRIEDARGSRIVMNPQGIELLAHGDVQIRAPGKTITVAAARIDFKKAEGEA